MKKLIGWNGCYGCMPFEICIAYGETREENFEIQRKISSIIKRLNGKEVLE